MRTYIVDRVAVVLRLFSCVGVLALVVACTGGGGPTQTCSDGQIVGCTCGATAGAQTCASGAWTACNCEAGGCTEGTTVACRCGGQAGAQSCSGGAWSACTCSAGACQDGQTLPCKCATGAGAVGTQSCSGAAWGACQGCGSTNPPGGDCPTPNQTEACQCNDGKSGTRTCGADKKWAACDCSGTNPQTCTAGATEACQCVGGKSGTRSCASDGSWGACTCNTAGVCTDGEKRDCICDGGTLGSQACVQNAWGTCGSCQDPKDTCPTPGKEERCFCSNGAASWKMCQADKTWAACDCGGPACTIGEVRKDDCDCPNGFRGDNECIKNAAGNPTYQCQCDCTPGEKKVCDCPNNQKGERTCKADKTYTACKCPTCKTDADCASQATAKVCDTTSEACVECLKDEQCTNGKLCAPDSASCVECLTDDDCKGKAAATCYPLDNVCKAFGRGALEGILRRCSDAAGAGQCSGNKPKGDDKGKIYFIFFSGKRFPPSYNERPFFVHATDVTDFKDPTKTVSFKIEGIPEGSWLVYVFIDDNNNWSKGQPFPDPGDLVGFIQGVTITANTTNTQNFPLTDRY